MGAPSAVSDRAESGSFLTDNLRDAFTDAAEMQVAKVIGEILHKHYPPPKGMPFWWAVSVNGRGGVAYVYNLALSGTHGYILHLHNLYSAGNDKLVMRAGGESLERFGMPADARLCNADRVAQLQRNFAGNIKMFMD